MTTIEWVILKAIAVEEWRLIVYVPDESILIPIYNFLFRTVNNLSCHLRIKFVMI